MAQLDLEPAVPSSGTSRAALGTSFPQTELTALPLTNTSGLLTPGGATTRVRYRQPPVAPLMSLWSNTLALKYFLLLSNPGEGRPHSQNYDNALVQSIKVFAVAAQSQLTSYCFGARHEAISRSNVWIAPPSQHALRKKLVRFITLRNFKSRIDS